MTSSRYRKPEPALIEQRKMPRRNVAIQRTSVTHNEQAVIDAKIQDISIYGCCLALDAILPANEVIEITFENGRQVQAAVVWQERNRMGCRFVKPINPGLFRKMTLKG